MKSKYRKQLLAATAALGLVCSGVAMANFDGTDQYPEGYYKTHRYHHYRDMSTSDRCANVTGDLYTKCRLYGGDEQ